MAVDASKDPTQYFFELTPDRVLEAVEASGLRCTGRCSTLNSFENRVYEVELDRDFLAEEPVGAAPRHSSAYRRVAKFYRPGRWTKEQILEEHEFLFDLIEAEIPAIAPIRFADGQSLHRTAVGGIWYAIFPKVGGRAPDEMNEEQLLRVGRLLARIHNVGAAKKSLHRVHLTPQTYGETNLRFLLEGNWIPLEYQRRYESTVQEIIRRLTPWFEACAATTHRLHGDCHPGNLLWNAEGPFFLDFDDMVVGPAAQDLWLLVPGRDEEAMRHRALLLEGYEEMRAFDRTTIRMIEGLRALRFVHYTAWVARRWKDPAFPLAFPEFGSHQYWSSETEDLEEQLRQIVASG